MKSCLLMLIGFFLATADTSAQLKTRFKKNPVINMQIKPAKVTPKISYDPTVVKNEIDSLLNKCLEKYTTSPNTKETWTEIKNESYNIILPYFRSGQLLGTKPEETFFVKMGAEPMTANDISNHAMILQAGIAPSRPAEFIIINVVKKNRAVSQ